MQSARPKSKACACRRAHSNPFFFFVFVFFSPRERGPSHAMRPSLQQPKKSHESKVMHGYIDQWLERLTADQQVPSSNLGVPSFVRAGFRSQSGATLRAQSGGEKNSEGHTIRKDSATTSMRLCLNGWGESGWCSLTSIHRAWTHADFASSSPAFLRRPCKVCFAMRPEPHQKTK